MSVAFRIWSLLRHPAGAKRWLLRLLIGYLLPAWCCIAGAAATAEAATGTDAADEPAPMCDPDGASVVAPENIPEVDRGRFEALPCEAQLLLSGWRLDVPELGRKAASCRDGEAAPVHHASPPPQRFEGARTLAVLFPVRSEPQSAFWGAGEALAPSRGHERGLFRPPVAR
jgi:hypothetical protein